MRIVVNHLTRMQKGFICVAGVDLATRRHVRPLPRGHLRTRDLARYGGPFDLACLLDLGRARPIGRPPEVEDFEFKRRQVQRMAETDPEEFWQLLVRVARPHLADLFGPDLRLRGRAAAVDEGKGQASLGCLPANGRPELYVRPRPGGRPQVRMRFDDGRLAVDAAVTDIRLYGDDHVTPDTRAVDHTAARLKEGAEAILAVGLSRPYTPSDEIPPMHWLQVNNIHFRDDPCRRLG